MYKAFQDQFELDLPEGWRTVFGQAISRAIVQERIHLHRRQYGEARLIAYEGIDAESLAIARMRWEFAHASRAKVA